MSSTTRIRFAIRRPAHHLASCDTLYALKGRLTILGHAPSPTSDPRTLALGALGWVLGDDDRAERLLSLTGLTPDALRAGLGDPEILGAVIDFLCAYEPDLIAAAEALGVDPTRLAAAKYGLAA